MIEVQMKIPDWVYEQDPEYQEERDGCYVCGGALEYGENGELIPCEGFGNPDHDEREKNLKKR
jgi:hypothetical protein